MKPAPGWIPARHEVRAAMVRLARSRLAAVVCAAVALVPLAAPAQQADALRSAAMSAIARHPDVNARLEAYRAAVEATSAARGAYWPRVDLNASAGRDESRNESGAPADQSLRRSAAGLTISQILWDGLATRSDVARSSHEQLARYFELLDTTEQIALEVARAHYDVIRLRRFVELAEENYVQHRYAFLQIQSRVRAGVGRGVDLEQASARLAQAESSLSTEIAGLHDASVRYLRMVGTAPPRSLPRPVYLREGMPRTATEAVAAAIRQNAAISAGIENMRATRALIDVRQAVYQPRAEVRVRATGGQNVDGVRDRSRSSTAELVLTWNLYNGGADQARVREQFNLLNQAANQRDRACHDTRQFAAIAFNDIARLGEQIVSLGKNAAAIEKARDAYRQQFEIGQRSLLDLLNAESERFSAHRAHAGAEVDLALAYARVHAAMNRLSHRLGLGRTDVPGDPVAEWAQADDAPMRCSADAIAIEGTDRSELDARAQRLSGAAGGPGSSRRP